MCYASSCNPLCGNCRPKRIVQVSCPECGVHAQMSREEYLVFFGLPFRKNILAEKIAERGVAEPTCSCCGASLVETFRKAVVPEECKSNRVICGFPCGRKDDPYREDALPCPTMVPLGRATTEPPASA